MTAPISPFITDEIYTKLTGEKSVHLASFPKYEEQYINKGVPVPEDEINKLKSDILKKYDYEGSAFYSTARLWDDGIIDPVDTRRILAMGIASSLNMKFPPRQFGVFRM